MHSFCNSLAWQIGQTKLYNYVNIQHFQAYVRFNFNIRLRDFLQEQFIKSNYCQLLDLLPWETQSRKHEMCYAIHIPFFSLISDHSFNSIVVGISIGVGVLIAVVVGSVILWVRRRGNSRKENTKGDYGMRWIIEKNSITLKYSSKICMPTIKRVLNQSSTSLHLILRRQLSTQTQKRQNTWIKLIVFSQHYCNKVSMICPAMCFRKSN